MKKTVAILAVLAAVLAVFLFASCEEIVDALSAGDCVEGFVDDANDENFGDLKQYIHPNSPYYEQSNATNMENWLGPYIPITDVNVVGSIGTATGDGGEDFVFTLQEDGDDYKIYSVTVNGMPASFSVY